MRPHSEHHFSEITVDPGVRRCAIRGCWAVQRVEMRRLAPAVAHSETSVSAARAIEPSRETLRAKVLEAIRRGRHIEVVLYGGHGAAHHWDSAGLTDAEGIEATGLDPSTYRPRRIELVEAGLVGKSGLKRKTRSGRAAEVWIAK